MVLRSTDTSPPSRDADLREQARIREVYDGYATSEKHRRIWTDNAASRFMQESKWTRIAGLLQEACLDPTAGMCLDLGAGGGDECRWIQAVGVPGDQIVGLDLLEGHLRLARRAVPWVKLIQGDARHLPFPEGRFSLVYQSTMLSSVLDRGLRSIILKEVGRVLRPGGLFVSFDTRYPNPWNPNTRPLSAQELRAAFAEWRIWARSVNGIPQLIRLLAPVSLSLCRLVESIPPLRSHLLFVARKPGS